MPRLPRFVLPGHPHHVTHRGNNREPVFFDDQDYVIYRRMLFAEAAAHEVKILAYCLMPNHIHAICVPAEAAALSRLFRKIQATFARFMNVRRERCGHLWQDRFYSCVMDSGHTVQAMAYIERNPVRARLVGAPEDWAWSSADVHLNGSDPDGKLDLEFWSRFYTPAQWKLALATSVFEESWIRRFRSSSERGYAFADEEFIDRFQKDSNRNLKPVKPGPKPGSATVSPPQQRAAAGATGQ